MQKVVLNIPHSSIVVPQWAVKDIIIPSKELDLLVDFMKDKNVDKIWAFVPNENKQVATVSRLIVDTERYRNDKDEAMSLKGMGLYYTHTPDGKQFRTRSEDTYSKCLSIYDEYHSSLEAKVTQCLAEHGKCVVLDCHSFHDGMNYTGFPPSSFPDVCIGVNDTICAEAQFVIDTFKSAGYTVKVNEPFAGSLVPLKYFNDTRVQSVMIELNRRIYDNALFDTVQNLCMKIYNYLCNEKGERKVANKEQESNNWKTYKKIDDVIKEIDKNAKEIRLSLGVVDDDAPYLLHYDVSLHLPSYCDAKNEVYDFLNRIDMLHTITILEQKK